MARKSKHIRLQVAHKAAQMMAEEGISDYAFAKRKAAKFFGLIDGDALPSNDEINDAIKEHQAIFFDEEHEERLKILRLEALSLMKRLSAFNPHLTGSTLDGTAGRYPTIHIQIYADSMKEVEFFLLNHNIAYETRERKSRNKDPMQDKKIIPILTLEGSMGPIELLIYHVDDSKLNKTKFSITELERLLN
ncbi:hypothetical protein FIT77_06170 [Candidatus Methylopumilus universalis]|uniref:hypothetical protein n=1 Tax=Candidatus Methylopumilus universalis TaxID=2588536 RepID=UPI00111F878F|nr:hypothetical protein [Candidatus Methylopumilus universalis]QDC96857.1 hypothetical protein FIT77_06170 [Candidatus Methylopumilus universalis]